LKLLSCEDPGLRRHFNYDISRGANTDLLLRLAVHYSVTRLEETQQPYNIRPPACLITVRCFLYLQDFNLLTDAPIHSSSQCFLIHYPLWCACQPQHYSLPAGLCSTLSSGQPEKTSSKISVRSFEILLVQEPNLFGAGYTRNGFNGHILAICSTTYYSLVKDAQEVTLGTFYRQDGIHSCS